MIKDLKKAFKAANERKAKLDAIYEMTQKVSNYAIFNQMYIDFITEMIDKGLYSSWTDYKLRNLEVNLQLSNEKVRIINPVIGWNKSWDEIGHLVNELNYGTTFRYTYKDERQIDGATVYIGDYVQAELPQEEIDFLEMLGKVERKVVPAHVENTMLCEV